MLPRPHYEYAFRLNGKVALVTGCNKGIGQAMALCLAEAGADIIGVSATLALSGSETEQQVRALGRNFSAYQADFSQRDSVDAFITKVQHDFPRIDILINNAGTIRRAPAAEHGDEPWDEVLTINLDTPFRLARAIGSQMLAQGTGKIIFTASLMSFQGGINVLSYAASKGAIVSLVKALANEWASRGVNVNAIVPSYIATNNTEAHHHPSQHSSRPLGTRQRFQRTHRLPNFIRNRLRPRHPLTINAD